MNSNGWCFLVGVLLLASLPSSAESADPSWYLKKETWQETMLRSREALVEAEREKASTSRLKSYTSEIVRGGEVARRVSVPVSGAKELFLFVTGAPDTVWGAATWADAKLIAKDGTANLVGQLEGRQIVEGRFDIDRNMKAGVSGPLKINGRRFDRGVHVYANSEIRIPLNGEYETFEAWIGIDDWVGKHGAVRFRITGPEGAARQHLSRLLARDFPEESPRRQMKWERQDRILEQDWVPGDVAELARRYAAACSRIRPLAVQAGELARRVADEKGLRQVQQFYYRSRTIDQALARARTTNFAALRLAINDLIETFGSEYSVGQDRLARLTVIEKAIPQALDRTRATGQLADFERVVKLVADFQDLHRQALLANPLLDFDRLLVIKRKPDGDPRRSAGRGYGVGEYLGVPRQSSKHDAHIERPIGWDNEIAVLSPPRPEGKLTTLYRPAGGELINDVDLDFDAEKLIFSMPGGNGRWRVWEIAADGTRLHHLPASVEPDVDYYDPCYLPSSDIAFISTAAFQGVPCNTSVTVGMMYRMDGDGTTVQQVCFEQDHDYYPTVLNDGRVMYLRWDYTDTPHIFNRMLFTMNPDGTEQAEYYGSNSYWPNAIFYARPIPNHPTKVVAIVTGHHVGRPGELVIFDPTLGKHEVSGVVQRIPGYGQKVEPLIQDKLTEHSWPKFLHPYPLSENYFLVSCKPTPDSLWGIYLVDVFDNMVLLKEVERHALLEPVPFRETPTPPVIPDRVKSDTTDAFVNLMDVYEGPAMRDLPRGSIKQLRVFTYHFAFQRQAGISHRVGADGPWEVKKVLGTVPVEEDGSAFFRIPAKTPISVQPLDANGRAVQLMRSWMTAMPGETLSCVGCHQQQRNASPPNSATLALRHGVTDIQPWRGPTRGFSFKREVQPVLDKYCVGCHNGQASDNGSKKGSGTVAGTARRVLRTTVPDPFLKTIPDLRGDQGALVVYRRTPDAKVIRDRSKEELLGKYDAIFEPSYLALRSFVRVGGLESDLHLLNPMEFHANTTELVQMLEKGHHNVRLDDEAWDRLITWIDLNAPCHGSWSEFTPIKDSTVGPQRQRRLALRKLYGGIVDDGEDVVPVETEPIEPIVPEPVPEVKAEPVEIPNWPFGAPDARRRQAAAGPVTRSIDLGGNVTLRLAKVPAGSFVMGEPQGEKDERPPAAVTIAEPFWMSAFEITNAQFQQFDPSHDSRFEHRTSWIFSEEYLGWPVDRPQQPVVRVSWNEAMAFCRWLSKKLGAEVTLPTEGQWEYA